MSSLEFLVLQEDQSSFARAGLLVTPRGVIPTPAFMPVGTAATVKALLPEQVREAGYGLILANTYHLAVRPGVDLIARHGGLHNFMGWPGAILTDSGGFQVYSLARLRRITADGVEFRSHVDGSLFFFTPEDVIRMQEALGSDIAMVLDVCPPADAPPSKHLEAVELTTEWARRSLSARSRQDQAVFGIVQGGLDLSLRLQHLSLIAALPFEGIAIGGLSVGEPFDERRKVLRALAPHLPKDRPRYLMGVGTPRDLIEGVLNGIDLFDCVFPTRAGRNGLLFTSEGRLQIKNAAFRDDISPLDPECHCPVCSRFSRAYLRHLYTSREILASVLNSLHNLHYFSSLMARIRKAILDGNLMAVAKDIEARYPATDGGSDARVDFE